MVMEDGTPFQGRLHAVVHDDSSGSRSCRVTLTDVTERKLMEEALGKSHAAVHEGEDKYRQIVETTRDGIWMIDVESRTTFVNRRMAVMLGYTPEEMTGKPIFSFMTDDARAIAERSVARRKEGITEEHDFCFQRKDGSEVWTIMEATPLISPDGTYEGALATVTDISGRKVAEANLQEAERRFREVLENSLDAAYKRDLRSSSYSYLSPVFAEISGYTPDEIKSLPLPTVLGLMHLDDVAEVQRVVAEAVSSATGRSFEIDYRFRHKAGEYRWLRDRFTVLRDAEGCAVALIGSVADVTERKQTEEQLKSLKENLTATLSALPDLMFDVDREGRFFDYRAPNTSLLLIEPEAFLGRRVQDVLPPPAARAISEGIAEAVRKGKHVGGRFPLTMPDGERWFELSISAKGEPVGGRERFIVLSRDITERREAEAAAREAEERYRLLAEATSEGVAILDEGRLTDCNKQFATMHGYEVAELSGRELVDFMSPESAASILEHRRAGSIGRHEGIAVRKDGSRFPVEGEERLVSHQGTTRSILALRDLTDQKRAKEEIEQLARLHEALIEINEAIPRVSSKAELFREVLRTLVERGGFRMAWIGWRDTDSPQVRLVASHGDESGYLNDISVYIDLRPEGKGPTGTAMREERPYICNDFMSDPHTLPWREAASRASWHSSTALPIRYAGEVRGALTVYSPVVNFFGDREVAVLEQAAADISFGLENLEREESLRENEREMREAQAIAGFGSYALDVGSGQWRSSEHLEAIFGIGPGWDRSVAGWGALIHPEEREAMTRYVVEQVIGRGTGFDRKYRIVRPSDGETRWVHGKGEVSFGPDGRVTHLKGTITDITERRAASKRINQLNAELEQRVRERTADLEAVNQELEGFSYSVSHDLRAPLRAIEGFSAIVVRDHGRGLDPEVRRLLGVVRTNTRRMSELIDDLLKFSRMSRTQVQRSRLKMKALAQFAFHEVAGDPETRAKIDFRLEDLPDADGDAGLVQQVWVNLLSNAVKFSAKTERPRIEVTGVVEGDLAVYRVQDNGAGFDMAYSDKLFGVFQRLHGVTEFEGTGIGLALVQRIVTRHGGQVWAEGEVGKGATFSFSLPVKPRSDSSTSWKKLVLPPGTTNIS